jgi:hypothetical protein
MSAHEWKPGEIVLVESGCWANHKVALRLAEGWSTVNGVNVDGDGVICPVRPLVVIDPEDEEQVERFREIASRHADDVPYAKTSDADYRDAMQAALREFASPKPPQCKSALIVKGEHFGCDQSEGHGMSHANTAAGAIWGESE